MRTTILCVLAALTIGAAFESCGSKGSSTPEAALSITTNPVSGSDQAPAPGPTFTLTVTVTSTMPPKGVTIAVSANVDGNSTTFYTSSVSTSAATTTFNITNTPAQETCDVSITVTSNTEGSNQTTASYKYAMK
jgi:hypothetical protein